MLGTVKKTIDRDTQTVLVDTPADTEARMEDWVFEVYLNRRKTVVPFHPKNSMAVSLHEMGDQQMHPTFPVHRIEDAVRSFVSPTEQVRSAVSTRSQKRPSLQLGSVWLPAFR